MFKFLALLALSSVSQAGTFTYSPATDGSYRCITYCTGFVTSDPAHTVQYVNLQLYSAGLYRITMSVDSVTYSGIYADPTQQNQLVEQSIVNGVVVHGSRTILASANYTTKRTCTGSGRGQHCTTWYFANSGSVTQ